MQPHRWEGTSRGHLIQPPARSSLWKSGCSDVVEASSAPATHHPGGPHWTRFSVSVSFLGWGAQSWMQWSSPTNLKEGTKDFPSAAAYLLTDRPQSTVGLFCWKDVVLPHFHHSAHQTPQVLFCSTAFWPANPHLYLERPPHSRMLQELSWQLQASCFAAVTKASGSPGEGLPAPSLEGACALGFLCQAPVELHCSNTSGSSPTSLFLTPILPCWLNFWWIGSRPGPDPVREAWCPGFLSARPMPCLPHGHLTPCCPFPDTLSQEHGAWCLPQLPSRLHWPLLTPASSVSPLNVPSWSRWPIYNQGAEALPSCICLCLWVLHIATDSASTPREPADERTAFNLHLFNQFFLICE